MTVQVIWRGGSWSTLVQVMACCLTAASHYLNQYWLTISEIICIHPKVMFTWIPKISNPVWVRNSHIYNNSHMSQGQWVKSIDLFQVYGSLRPLNTLTISVQQSKVSADSWTYAELSVVDGDRLWLDPSIACLGLNTFPPNVQTDFIPATVLDNYRKISNITRTKSTNMNVSRLVLLLYLPNPMKPDVKSRMKMYM